MEILVCVKQVLDTRLSIAANEQGTVTQNEPWPVYAFNAPDRAALEAALHLRDEVDDGRVTALTVGPARAQAVLAHCLARGADRVVHLLTDDSTRLDSFAVARALSIEIARRQWDLILCGERSEDDGASEVGPVLGELLDVAQVTNVVKLSVSPLDHKLVAERKLERGYRQAVEAYLPALVTVDSTIRAPRYVTLRAIQYATRQLSQHSDLTRLDDTALLEYCSALRRVLGATPPKPRPKRTAQPDAGMSADDRLAALLGGAISPRAGPRATGDPERLADEIIAFLRDKGLLS